MNIFILDKDPYLAAQMLCDKHIPKMIVESAQMLSTAHRLLDGTPEKRRSKSGKTVQTYYSFNDGRESSLGTRSAKISFTNLNSNWSCPAGTGVCVVK